MSTILPNPEVVKIEVDQFQSVSIEREKIVKMEMQNLVRERELLKKEVNLLEKTQRFTELEKCSLEEKLGRSERRCGELEEKIKKFEDSRQKEMETAAVVDELRVKSMELEKCSLEEKLGRSERRCEELNETIVQMGEKVKKLGQEKLYFKEKLGRIHRTCEDLRKKEIETTEVVDELRVKKMESEKADKLYKRRIDDIVPRVLKLEAALAKVLNVNLSNLDKFAASATNAEVEENLNRPDFVEKRMVKADADGNGGIGLSKKGASYRLNSRCTLKTIDVIKENLQEEKLEIFEQLCFGNLLKIKEYRFQGELLMQLLLHMDMRASNEERLIFKVNNSDMEFGPSDFFRITGLRLGKLEATITTSSSSIHMDVFQGRPTITMKNIEEAFLNNSKGKGKYMMKLALLYFLYGTLLSTRSTVKIDMRYLYLIEDLQKFNSYPWGRVAYDILVSSILQLRHRMDTSQVIHPVESLNIYGFCYALQAWAYEVMPSLGTYCACRVNNFENVTPSILRWYSTRIIKPGDLKIFFPRGEIAHSNNAMGKWEDLSTATIPHVATPLNTAKQKKRKLLCDHDQMPRAQPSSAMTPPSPSMNASTYSSHHLARRLSWAEGMLESLLRKVDQPILDISDDELPSDEFPRVDDEEDVCIVSHSD